MAEFLDRSAEREHRLLSGLISGLACLAVGLLILGVVLGRQSDQELMAARQCALLSSDALWIYAVVPHLGVVPDVSPGSSPLVLLRPPTVDNSDLGIPAPMVPPPPIASLPAPTVPEAPPVDDWHPLLLGMVWQHDRLRAMYPREIGQADAPWQSFSSALQGSGQLRWSETTELSGALRSSGDSLQSRASDLHHLSVQIVIGGLLLLAGLFAWATGLLGRRRLEGERVQSELKRLETVLEAAGEGVLQVDALGGCTYINSAAATLLGYRAKELRGKNMARLLYQNPEEGSTLDSENNPLQHTLKTGETARDEDDILWRRDGSSFPAATVASPIMTPRGLSGAVVTFSDISGRKSAEVLRDDLTEMIVHDLRTPLTSLLTGLQTLSLAGEMNPAQTEMLGIALGGGETLLAMVSDLLDISKMEAGLIVLDKRPVIGAEVIEQALSQIAPLARTNGLRVARHIAPDLPIVIADEEKLRRALVNLLGNAVKFTPRGGIVTIAAAYDPAEGGVVFAVGDTGEGIPAHAVKRIFEKFGQVESRKAGRKMSTGLGLTFCKLVAESHGGRIWVESKLGKGSRFLLTIPATLAGSSTRP